MTAISAMACPDCDLLQRIPTVPEGSEACCRRCGAVLIRNKPKSFTRPLAMLLTGVILFGIFNAFPFLAFKKAGRVQQTHVITGIRQLSGQGMPVLAALVAFTTIIAPGFNLLASLYVILPLNLNRKAPGMFHVFRYLKALEPWHMVEIFMLGVLVSIAKLAEMAQIVPGAAVYSLTALIFVMAAASASIDPHEVWERWEGPR